jgi:transposase-like protein
MTDTATLKRVRLWAEHGLRSDLSDLAAAVSHIDALEAEVTRLRAILLEAEVELEELGAATVPKRIRAALEQKP